MVREFHLIDRMQIFSPKARPSIVTRRKPDTLLDEIADIPADYQPFFEYSDGFDNRELVGTPKALFSLEL